MVRGIRAKKDYEKNLSAGGSLKYFKKQMEGSRHGAQEIKGLGISVEVGDVQGCRP